MSDDIFHTETVDHADPHTGEMHTYTVAYMYDNDSTPLWTEDPDAYGVTFEMDENPHSRYFDLEGYINERENWGHDPMEETVRLQMCRVMHSFERRGGSYLVFDTWATLARARAEGWGPDPEEAVESLYRWMRGWYCDDWHFIGITVTDDRTGWEESLWGVESNDTNYHQEVVDELIAQHVSHRKYERQRQVEVGYDAVI